MIALLLSILLLMTSCPASCYDIERVETPSIYTLPVLEDLVLIENSRISLSFDRPVEILEMKLEDESMEASSIESRLFNIRLPHEIPYGREYRLRFTCRDRRSGNLSRISVPIMGINTSQAKVLMTEVSVKGTDTSPDRVELAVLEGGTTGSLTITDGILGVCSFSYTLPDVRVSKGDVIVVHMSAPHKGEDIIRIGNRRIFNIDAPGKLSFLSTNGAVLLYSHTNGNGKLIDALLYRKEDTVSSDGWGNEKTRRTASSLYERGEWKGKGFTSDGNTSTRVFARYYPYQDTNSSRDWYLTATRGSTFGFANDNNEYIVPDKEDEDEDDNAGKEE